MALNNNGSSEDWRDGQKSLAEQLWYFYQYEIGTDLEVCIVHRQSQRLYRCHKIVFMRLSAQFEKMINDYIRVDEEDICVLGLSSVSPDVFEIVLKFAYTDLVGEFSSYNQVMELKKFCNTYGIKTLPFHCELFLSNLEVDEDTIWDLMGSADRTKKITSKIKKFLANNTLKCLESSKFTSCSQPVLLEMLSKETLSVDTELQLVQATLRWATAHNDGTPLDPESSKRLLGACLNHLRFLALTPAEFSGHVANTGLFSSEDSLKILVRLTSKQLTELPEGISIVSEPRTRPPTAAVAPSEPPKTNRELLSVAMEEKKLEANPIKTDKPQQAKTKNNGTAPPSKDLIWCYRGMTPGLEMMQTNLITRCTTKANKISLIEFTVDKPVKLHTVQLVTQTQPLLQNRSTYDEYLHLFVRHCGMSTQNVAYHTFITSVNYNSTMDIQFSAPGNLQPGKNYVIEIIFKEEGVYSCSARSSVVLTDNMQICFSRDTEKYPYSGLVQSLYLSK